MNANCTEAGEEVNQERPRPRGLYRCVAIGWLTLHSKREAVFSMFFTHGLTEAQE